MNIAISLALAVAERSAQTALNNLKQHCSDDYAAYPLRGGRELWSVSLSSAASTKADKSSKQVSQDDLQLSWHNSAVSKNPAVSLVPSGTKRMHRALRHLSSGFELPLSRPVTLVASGLLTFAISLLVSTEPLHAASVLPVNCSRAVQCSAENIAHDSLLATISQPARHRVFSRAGDVDNGKGGKTGHTNTIKTYNDSGVRGNDGGGHMNISWDPSTGTWTGTYAVNGHMNSDHIEHINCQNGNAHQNVRKGDAKWPITGHANVNNCDGTETQYKP